MQMQDIHHSDVADVVAAARASLLESIDIETLWHACVQLVAHTLPCHSCSLMLSIQSVSARQVRHYQAEAEEKKPLAFSSFSAAVPYLIANPPVRFYAFSQLELLDPLDDIDFTPPNSAIEHYEVIYLAFWDKKTLACVLSICISKGKTAFSDCDLAFLNDLYSMLDAGLRRIRRLESERIRQCAIEASLDRLPFFLIVVDEHKTPIYLTPSAEKVCRAWGGVERLSEKIDEALRLLPCDHENCLAPDAGRTLKITHCTHTELRMRVDISPPLQLVQGQRHYILKLTEDNASGELPDKSARVLSLLQQLSPSERKVARLISYGLRNDAVAERLCRSRKTIETHVSSIYRKLEIKSRSQLVRLFSQ